MTWTTFFATPDDFAPLTEALLQLDGAQLLEVYSRPGQPARAFTRAGDAVGTLQLGMDPGGKGIAAHCALWVPSVMPAPTHNRIELRAGSWRESVEGCGLFWLQAGGIHGHSITDSRFGWFTEAAARKQCTAQPSFATVDWRAHAAVAAELKAALRRLTSARAKRFPVLAHAGQLHASGYRLLYGPGIKREIAVGAV